MLPPQLRQGLVLAQRNALTTLALKATTTSLLRAGLAHNQSRSFWGWRRSNDWSSHLDPGYQRFCRIRTLKTRAKLLKNLRRRGKFDWDVESRPFFTPKHVRWASHWDGSGRSGRRAAWMLNEEPQKKNEGEQEGVENAEEAGYELSQREKIWKEQMEAMRKRIEQDPYESIFGKRFEPFWSPLVPSWMREEMGLQGWPKAKEAPQTKPDAKHPRTAGETNEAPQGSQKISESKSSAKSNEVAAAELKAAPKTTSYSYASSTSWDSWTNKTKRVEWDSVSGQTKKYEYDPISNRMVLVELPKPATETRRIDVTTEQTKPTKDATTTTVTNKTADVKPSNIPAKQSSSDLRKSIPIPPPLSQPSHSIPLGFAVVKSSAVGPLRSTALSSDAGPKPSALATVPEKMNAKIKEIDIQIDMLTADGIRASVGKAKSGQTSLEGEKTAEKTAQAYDLPQIDAILKERDLAKDKMLSETTAWNHELESLQKKKEKLIKDERGLFHIERQKRELGKLDERIKDITARVDKLNVSPTSAASATLQPSLDRMQSSKPLAEKKTADLDDSAAHESTEPFQAYNAVPKNWAQQADLLQADRIRRTRGVDNQAPRPASPRWLDDMKAKKAAYEAKKAEVKAANAQRDAKLAKANEILEAEVQEVKLKMQQHEGRYAHKIRALRHELEVAYKQSAVHSEKHLERIRDLEKELAKTQKAAGGQNVSQLRAAQGEGDVDAKVANFVDSGKWYKHPASPLPAAGSGVVSIPKPTPSKAETEKVAQKARDQELVKQVREIYEREYGVIDANHRQSPLREAGVEKVPKKQPQVVEVETDVDLGEALARYENESKKDAVTSSSGHTSSIQWADPPVYKVLAYDSGNDMMSTATTTSNFTGSEEPISIQQALAELYQPARFVPYFAQLQSDGYQAVFGTKDLLVFKMVKSPQQVPAVVKNDAAKIGLEDHGLVAPIDNVTTAQAGNEAQRFSINPVDGTPAAVTGNFASPTGFVNHDPVPWPELEDYNNKLRREAAVDGENDADIDWRHYPRVRREEAHFTGMNRKWNGRLQHRQQKREQKDQRRGRSGRRKTTWRWVMGVGLGAAGVVYLVGAASEKARKKKQEDWAKRLEGDRRR